MGATVQALLERDSILLVWELRLLWITAALYLISSVFYLAWLLFPGSKAGRKASRMAFAGATVHSVVIALRIIEGEYLPYQTPFESFILFAWLTAIIYVFIEKKFQDIFAAGLPFASVASAACLYALLRCDPVAVPLLCSFESAWFSWHTLMALVSYAVFVVAFSMELGYVVLAGLLLPRMLSKYGMYAETTARFHRMAHQLVLFGFPLCTFSLISGAVWAEQAYGRYWSWTTVETLSLITWIVYALYLHSMTMVNWRGRRASALNIVGFVCTLVTLFGTS